jgi:hypothetical protein
MVTHQNDWQRMAFMSWAIERFGCFAFVETGCCEGETVGYFSQFNERAYACDVDPVVVGIARERYPHVNFQVMDARDFLRTLTPYYHTFFYLDCTWGDYLPAKEQLPIIKERWTDPAILVSGVILSNGSKGQQNLDDLRPYGKLIIPRYGQGSDMSGYALIVPQAAKRINLPDSWEIV